MNRRTLLAALMGALAVGCATSPGRRTQVMVIATLHGAHARTPTYSYDILYARIRAFAPTAIGVEIRPEDLHPAAAYLRDYYPREMIELGAEYGDRSVGLDWLGPAIEGRPIPEGYFQTMDVKVLERALDADTSMADPALDAIQHQQSALIPSATPSSLNDGRYDALNRQYYAGLAAHLRGTRYQPISDFYAARDAHIDANAVALVRANPGGRVAIVIGADHRSAMIDALRAAFAGAIDLVPV
jgi:hypothetical protein